MATLQGTLILTRAVVSEVVSNPNTVPRYVVSGTSSSIQSGGGGSTKVEAVQQSGAFRQYGNGNVRLILGSAYGRTYPFALMALSPAQVATLTALLGHTVCYRDPYGRKMYGAFLDMQISNVPHSGKPEDGSLLTNVGITLQSVSYNEVV
jgi:hypothetical protein